MESNSLKSLGGRPAANPSSFAALEVSSRAPPCQRRSIGRKFHSGREPSGESGIKRLRPLQRRQVLEMT